MQNKTIRRFLVAAMTAAVAVTSMPLQNVVYAAETKQTETEETTQSETSEAIAEVPALGTSSRRSEMWLRSIRST